MDMIDILLTILIVIAIILGLYLIKLIKRLFVTIEIVETEIKGLDEKMAPLVSQLQELAESGNVVATFAKEQAELANSLMENIKSKFSFFVNRENNNNSPQENANSLVTNLKGIFKGVTTFINEIKK